MTTIVFKDVHKAYGQHAPVLRDVNLDLGEGEFVVFIGPSGCGKSTLLRMIAGLEEITQGELLIGGKRMNEVPPAERGIAMVFQSYALFPHMSVYENMAFGLELAKRPKAEIDAKVRAAARTLQLEQLLERKPKALSGGQRQRVAIGRAIVREPRVFLFDEPLSNLDTALRAQTRIEIARLHAQYAQASMVYVTHDQVEAMTLASKIVLLHTGQDVADKGSLAQVGTPLELFHRPRNLFVAGFIGSPRMNFLPATLVSRGPALAAFRLADGSELSAAVDASRLAEGAKVTLGVRPEHAHLQSGAGQALAGVVSIVERLGTSTYLYLERGAAGPGGEFVVAAPADSRARAGDRVELHLPAQALHVFDDRGDALPRTVDLPH
jgi:multiple sugar transport system ATP-binding protein